jgi:uncharacterized membrane protein YjdF
MQKVIQLMITKFNRSTFAYLLMLSFIILSSIGAGLIYAPAGLITAGASCGLFGYLLGRE